MKISWQFFEHGRYDQGHAVVPARLAWPMGGLRSCPLLVCDQIDPVLVPRVGDRFTPCRSQHAGFAMTIGTRYVIGKLAMPMQGLRSHPLHEIYYMDFATSIRVGDGFTASPTNQPWARNDDKNRVVIEAGIAGGRVTKLPPSCV